MKSTLVILHGWGLSKKRFEPLIAEFKKRGYPVLAPDFPGFGESEIPKKPLTLSDYAKFLDEFLTEHNVINPILIGHSFGGRVSLRYQLMYPKSVRVLILTGTPGFTPTARKKLMLLVLFAKMGKFVFSLPGLSLFMEEVRRWYYYVVGAKEFYRAQGSMRQTFKNIVTEKLLNDMEHVRIPCLLLWGANDIIVPVEIARRMKQVIHKSDLILIDNADHGVPFKEPAIFADRVETFLHNHAG